MALTSLSAVTVSLTENGHAGYVVVASRDGLGLGAVITLQSNAHTQAGLKVIKLDGLKVYLWEPVTDTSFDASAYLLSDAAQLVQGAQDLFTGTIRDFFSDPQDRETPLATSELADIFLSVLPGVNGTMPVSGTVAVGGTAQVALPIGAVATFGAVRTAEETAGSVFKAIYGINTRTCSVVTANGGTVTWDTARANLQTSTAANGSAKLATREAVRYIPGQGNIARGAPVFSVPSASSRQVWGFLSDTDGFGFGYNGTQFGVVVRNNSVDVWIPRASWNGADRLDGLGPSGITYNPQLGSPLQIQMQWLGYGAVRWYIELPTTGEFVLVHTYRFANTSATPSIRQPSLPVRMELVNTGSTTNLSAFIASMGGYSEGGHNIPGADVRNSFHNQVSCSTTGTRIFAMKNKDQNVFGGVNVNSINVHVDFVSMRDASAGQDAYVQLILNPTLTGASYSDLAAATSVIQTDTSSTWTAGSGTVLGTFCLAAGSTDTKDIDAFDIRLAPGDVLAVVGFSEAATAAIRVSLGWHEEN